MAKIIEIDYDGSLEDLKNEEISVEKGVVSIGDDDFKLKGHRKLEEPERITFMENENGDVVIQLEKRREDHGGPEGQFAIQNNDGTVEYTDGTPEVPEVTLEEDGFELECGVDPSAPEVENPNPTPEDAAPTSYTIPQTYSA